MIKCKQCGEIKTETEFRQYYGKTVTKDKPGRYKTCYSCESINSRYKYLNRKNELSEAEQAERSEIEELYRLLQAEGLNPPVRREIPATRLSVQEMIAQRRAKAEAIEAIIPGVSPTAPQEILEWFIKDLSVYEEWELQDIFDKLEEDYRPSVGVDPDTFKPIFDETHKDLLDKLEEHFEL